MSRSCHSTNAQTMPLHAMTVRRHKQAVSRRIALLPHAAPCGGTSVEAVRPPMLPDLHATDGLCGLQPLCAALECAAVSGAALCTNSVHESFDLRHTGCLSPGMMHMGDQERERGGSCAPASRRLLEMEQARCFALEAQF